MDITPDGVHYKSTQEESTPTDSMITDTSLEDLVFASYDSPVTSGYKPKLSLPDPRSSSEEIVHIQNQVCTFTFEELITYCILSTLMNLAVEREASCRENMQRVCKHIYCREFRSKP